jgi:hypothetical protein
VCVLYSMMVLVGRLRTRFNVSRMRDVVTWSLAVRFHRDNMSSCRQTDRRGSLKDLVDGNGLDGTGRDGTGRDGTGRDGTGRDGWNKVSRIGLDGWMDGCLYERVDDWLDRGIDG